MPRRVATTLVTMLVCVCSALSTLPAAAAALGAGAGSQHGGGHPQRTEVGRGVALPRIGAGGSLGQTAARLVEELDSGSGHRRWQRQLTGGNGTGGAHQSCPRTSHQRLSAASQDRS